MSGIDDAEALKEEAISRALGRLGLKGSLGRDASPLGRRSVLA